MPFRITAPETPRFVAHCHTSATGKVALHFLSDQGLCSSIVDSATSSHETAKLYRSLAQRPVNSRRRSRRAHLAPTPDVIGRAAGFVAQHLHASIWDAGFAPTQTQV